MCMNCLIFGNGRSVRGSTIDACSFLTFWRVMEPSSSPDGCGIWLALARRSFAVLWVVLAAGCAISLESPGHPAGAPESGNGGLPDQVLNQRRIFVFGSITETVAEEVIRKTVLPRRIKRRAVTLYLLTPGRTEDLVCRGRSDPDAAPG